MRVIAKAGPYQVIQELNGLVRLYRQGKVVAESDSAYTLIRDIEDHALRSELLAGWKADLDAQTHAEKNSREVQFHE